MTTILDSGMVTKAISRQLSISIEGCPHRGTPACLKCEMALACPALCEFVCVGKDAHMGTRECKHRLACPCGWSDPVVRRQVFESWRAEQ